MESCPITLTPGKPVKLVTLKALLKPGALAQLEPSATFRFCDAPDCPVVYFSEAQTFTTDDLLVPVYQKHPVGGALICSCFGHTAADLERDPSLKEAIRAHTKANRCGCEVRNPQGACCLGR